MLKLVKVCKCKARRCEAHAAAHVDAYEARRAARSVEQADREDRATARAALDLRAFLDALPTRPRSASGASWAGVCGGAY